MKFKVEQKELNKALGFVSKAVTTRSTMQILKGILVSVDDNGSMTLMASDMELSIEKKINVTDSEAGSVVIPARIFTEIIRKLPDTVIDFTIEEYNNVLIKTGMSEFRIVGMKPEEFPEIGTVNETRKLRIRKDLFRNMIQKTFFSASIDKSKGVIIGVLIEIRGENITMAALDGFRMAVARESASDNQDTDVIISAKILNEINRMIYESFEDEDEIELILDEHKAVIFTADSKIIIRIIEGKYLDYKKLLPSEFTTIVYIDRISLIDSIERASLFAKEGRNNLIKLSFSEDNLSITSQSEAGNVNENISVKKEGDDIEIGFNSKYLLEGLKAMEEDDIIFKLNTNVTPCIIESPDGKYTYLILPVRIIS
ncbi:MAG: DNA polymerase III subunit beta [Anaerovoracaceae bacterium]